MCIIHSARPNVYFLDVAQTYFDGYRDILDPVYKHAKGWTKTYVKGYTTPTVDQSMYQKIDIEGKKYLLKSNTDWKSVKQELQKMNRKGMAVSIQILILKNYLVLEKNVKM